LARRVRLDPNPFLRVVPIDVPHLEREDIESASHTRFQAGGEREWLPDGGWVATSTLKHRLVTFSRELSEGHFVASVTFAEQDGEPVLWGMTVRPTDESAVLPAYGLTVRRIRKAITDVYDDAVKQLGKSDPTGALAFLAKKPKSGRPRQATATDHALLAWAYVSARERSPRSPLKYLSDESGLDHDRLRGWRTEARREGFLTKSARGRPEGDLTAIAVGIIEALGYDLDRDDAFAALGKTPRVQAQLRLDQSSGTSTLT
jgi:hypothetical protein